MDVVDKKEFYMFSSHIFITGISMLLFQTVDFLMVLGVSKETASVISYADSVFIVFTTVVTGYFSVYFSEVSKDSVSDGVLATTFSYTCVLSLFSFLTGIFIFNLNVGDWFHFDEYVFLSYLSSKFSIIIFILIYSLLEITTRLLYSASYATKITIISLGINAIINYFLIYEYVFLPPEKVVILSTVMSRTIGILIFSLIIFIHCRNILTLSFSRCLVYKYNKSLGLGVKNGLDWAGGALIGTLLSFLSGPAFIAYQIFYRASVVFYRIPQSFVTAAHKEYAKFLSKNESIDDNIPVRSEFERQLLRLISYPSMIIALLITVMIWFAYFAGVYTESKEVIYFLALLTTLELIGLWFYIKEQSYSTFLICIENFQPLAKAGVVGFVITSFTAISLFLASGNIILVCMSEIFGTVLVSFYLKRAFNKGCDEIVL
ncbi:hypothetical protein ACLHFD_001998 [Vibrio alginolyticus]